MSHVSMQVNGVELEVEEGISVAAALVNAGIWQFRAAARGPGKRGPICAMGICFECRVTLDGHPHRRACMETCRQGMHVVTGE
jgi:predicted molibdopterin-dependent oxidoreductase YjgC